MITFREAAIYARVDLVVIEDAVAAGDLRTDTLGAAIRPLDLETWRRASRARQLIDDVVQLSA